MEVTWPTTPLFKMLKGHRLEFQGLFLASLPNLGTFDPTSSSCGFIHTSTVLCLFSRSFEAPFTNVQLHLKCDFSSTPQILQVFSISIFF